LASFVAKIGAKVRVDEITRPMAAAWADELQDSALPTLLRAVNHSKVGIELTTSRAAHLRPLWRLIDLILRLSLHLCLLLQILVNLCHLLRALFHGYVDRLGCLDTSNVLECARDEVLSSKCL